MADFACSPPSQCDKMKAARKVLEAPAEPEHSEPETEARTMSFAAYNIRSGGLKPEQSSNWKSIGELAAELVRKAGAQ